MSPDNFLWFGIASQLGLPEGETIHLGDFVVPHAAVVVRQERGRFAGHDSCFAIRAGKRFDRL
jgi:hypothetical protein